MKKIILLFVLCILSVTMYAQKDVTKFLGIPVDGKKWSMIEKLKSKGFKYNNAKDQLTGEFNGKQVNLSVVTNNKKVYRIVVYYPSTRSKTSIRVEFNKLCQQFTNNKKYIAASDSQEISEDEDIFHEITVNDKRYEAAFYQSGEVKEFIENLQEEYQAYLTDKYTNEEIVKKGVDGITKEDMQWFFERMGKKSVWFMIAGRYGEYQIVLYYDNEYNRANGEDL